MIAVTARLLGSVARLADDCHFILETNLLFNSACYLRSSSSSPTVSPNKAVSVGLSSPVPLSWLGLAHSTTFAALLQTL